MKPRSAARLNGAVACDILKWEVGPALAGTKRRSHNWRRLGCFRFPFRSTLRFGKPTLE